MKKEIQLTLFTELIFVEAIDNDGMETSILSWADSIYRAYIINHSEIPTTLTLGSC